MKHFALFPNTRTNILNFLLIIFTIAITTNCALGEPCFNRYTRMNGICILIKDCEMYKIKIQDAPRPLPQDIIDELKNVHCGFEGRQPLVCCNIQTPTINVFQTPSLTTSNLRIITEHKNLNLVNGPKCGRSNMNRIFRGNKTGIFEFPWMALIAYRTGFTTQFRCGGTVINEHYILTAAHCIHHLKGMSVVGVRLGEHDTTRDPDCEMDDDGDMSCAPSPRDFTISKLIPHPDFNKDSLQNDIGLIRISGRTDYNEYVRPICLPIGPELQNNNLAEERPTIAGWGATEMGESTSADLLKINLPMVPIDQCKRIYRKSINLSEKQLCAGGSAEGADSCHGDSGGPMMHNGYINNFARFVQFGIISFGPRQCASRGQPGVYTKVGYYINWILDSIEP